MSEQVKKDITDILVIDISDDSMQAFLTIDNPEPEILPLLTPLKILSILDQVGVKYGIKKELLKKIIEEKKWGEKVLIAEGKLPTVGEDAKVELFFETEKSSKPKIKEDGHVDYKEINIVDSVEKNKILVKKIAPEFGNKGKDVQGNEIAAQKGKDIPLVAGKGTYWDDENSALLRAAEDGIVIYNPHNHTVEVQQLFIVQGSVDYSTGNINVKSSVDIKGDVKPGFSVTTPYNVSIKGVVEHSVISCEGNLKVNSGIIGDEIQWIKVGGDLNAGYINSQNVLCYGNVLVSTEIRNSVIECGHEVHITKSSGVIIGGRVIAANKVIAPFIGNSYSVPTEITVGVNPKFREALFRKREEKVIIENQMNELAQKITLIAQSTPEAALNSRIGIYKKQWNECCEKSTRLKNEVEELEKEYYNTADPQVEVSKTVYPGTTIKIREANYEVKEELTHVKFILVENEIVVKPIQA